LEREKLTRKRGGEGHITPPRHLQTYTATHATLTRGLTIGRCHKTPKGVRHSRKFKGRRWQKIISRGKRGVKRGGPGTDGRRTREGEKKGSGVETQKYNVGGEKGKVLFHTFRNKEFHGPLRRTNEKQKKKKKGKRVKKKELEGID